MSNIPTPRTDAAVIYLELDHPLFKSVTYVLPEFARGLEREVSRLTQENSAMLQLIERMRKTNDDILAADVNQDPTHETKT